jgi:ribosomal protein S27E
MKDKKVPGKKARGGSAVELMCPKCKRTEIIYVPAEEVPKCPDCNIRMIIKEVLREGKSY